MGPGMGMGMQMRPEMRHQMILAPRMIQSMEILQLPIMALQERIQQELQENPVLEIKDNSSESKDGPAGEDDDGFTATTTLEDESDPGAKELVIDEASSNELDFDRLEAIAKDWDDHLNEEHRPSRNGIDQEGDKK